MPPFENPTDKELKATLENTDLPVGADIEARLGKPPSDRTAKTASSKDEEE